MFLTKPRSTEACEGDRVIIRCEVIGDPTPDVVWLRDFLKVRRRRTLWNNNWVRQLNTIASLSLVAISLRNVMPSDLLAGPLLWGKALLCERSVPEKQFDVIAVAWTIKGDKVTFTYRFTVSGPIDTETETGGV